MPGEQALSAFRSQLAERLQSARSGDAVPGWLAVRAGALRLLVPLSHASEIFPWPGVQHVPYVKPWFMGVANLRGSLSGVADLAAFLGQTQERRSAAALRGCWLVGLNPILDLQCALLVDELLGIRTTQAFVRSAPGAATDPQYFGQVYTDLQGGRWRELGLQALAQQQGFLDIGA